jgi:casein kinase I family protein HRR25
VGRRKVVQEEEEHRAPDRLLRSHTRQAQAGSGVPQRQVW